MHNLSYNAYITQVSTAILAAGSTEHLGVVRATKGYAGHLFVVSVGVIAATDATGYIKIQGATASGGTFVDIASSTATFNADVPNSLAYVDIWKPKHDFLRPVFNRATSNVTILGCSLIQYAPDNDLTSTMQSTYVVDTAVLVTPTTG